MRRTHRRCNRSQTLVETLEPRQLLSADLSLTLTSVTSPELLLAGISKGKAAVTLANVGDTTAAGATTISAYLTKTGAVDGDSIAIGSLSRSVRLLAGRSIAYSIPLTFPASAGEDDYQIVVVATPAPAMNDANSANNTMLSDPVHVATPFVDFSTTITQMQLPAFVMPGSRGKVTLVMQNDGNITSRTPSSITFLLSSDDVVDDADVPVGAMNPGTVVLRPGLTRTITANIVIPGGTVAGDYYVLAKVAPGSQVTPAMYLDVETSNDVAASDPFPVVEPMTDLSAWYDAVTLPGVLSPGSRGAATLVISNQGNMNVTRSVTARTYLTQTGDVDDTAILVNTATRALSAPAGGSDVTWTLPLVVPAGVMEGSYQLITVLDPDDALVEADETNNLAISDAAWDLVVPAPDLSIAFEDISDISLDGLTLQGTAATISVSLFNEGNITLSTTGKVRIYLSADDLVDASDAAIGAANVTVTSLGVGEMMTSEVTVVVPAGAEAGSYFVLARYVPTSAASDTNAENNVALADAPVEIVEPYRDLEVTGVWSTFDGSTPPPGRSGEVNFDLTNLGNDDFSGTLTARIYLSLTQDLSDTHVLIGQQAISLPEFAASDVVAQNIPVTIPETIELGEYFIVVEIKPPMGFVDAERANNMTATDVPVTVEDPFVDLEIDSPEVNPDTFPEAAGWGETGTFTVRVWNFGNMPTSGTITINVYATMLEGNLEGAVLLGSQEVTLADFSPGESQLVNVSVEIPQDTPVGNYQIVGELVPGTAADDETWENTAHLKWMEIDSPETP